LASGFVNVGDVRCGGGTNDVCKFLVDKAMIFDMDMFDVRVVGGISGGKTGGVVIAVKG
jgi:hypothetical protein